MDKPPARPSARRLADPLIGPTVVLAGVAVAGVTFLLACWAGVSRDGQLAHEVPFIVSGGFGGLGLLGTAAALLNVQERRRAEASGRHQLDQVLAAASDMLEAASIQRAVPR